MVIERRLKGFKWLPVTTAKYSISYSRLDCVYQEHRSRLGDKKRSVLRLFSICMYSLFIMSIYLFNPMCKLFLSLQINNDSCHSERAVRVKNPLSFGLQWSQRCFGSVSRNLSPVKNTGQAMTIFRETRNLHMALLIFCNLTPASAAGRTSWVVSFPTIIPSTDHLILARRGAQSAAGVVRRQ